MTTTQVTTPFRFCTSGATVFAPGVNLTDFSATYNSAFIPKESGEIVLEVYCYGSGRLRVNGEEVKSFSNKHGARKSTHAMKVQAGKSYNLELDFEYLRSDAQLNFDLGFKKDVDIRKSVERVKDADIVIFASGISPSLEGEEMGVNLPGFKKGDRTDIELPAVQRELIDALHRAGKKIILVNCSGSPIGLEPETQKCEAILQAWYPGQQGGKAVAEVLFGDYNPAGRLTISVPRSVGQLPVYYNTKRKGNRSKYIEEEGTPRYPFGYGLSYTSFNYSDLKAEVVEAEDSCLVNISVKVRNEGSRDGDEVVQLYLRDEVASFTTPFKQLCGFQRIHLKVGETKEITFRLDKKSLALYMQNEEWAVEPGRFTLMLGGSSEQIYQQKEIEITKRYTFKM